MKLPGKTRPDIRGCKNPFWGKKHTEETKAKISAKMKGHRFNLGRRHSETIRKHMSEAKTGPRNPHWNGGRFKSSLGYILIKIPGHRGANAQGYVPEHRLVMEAKLGRGLNDDEVVHHINGIRDDNRPENLQLFPSEGEHQGLHNKLRPIMASIGKRTKA